MTIKKLKNINKLSKTNQRWRAITPKITPAGETKKITSHHGLSILSTRLGTHNNILIIAAISDK